MSVALEVKNLRYRFADGTEALRGVSFSLMAGECVGVIGPNGAGKSTLLLHLNGTLPSRFEAQSPSVFVMGEAVREQNLERVRQIVGVVFQNPDDQLFCPTVLDDVAFGPEQLALDPEAARARARQALERVGLSGFGARSPTHLSAGEKRRACIAGVLACEPRVLVLDEPTSDLDPRGRRELAALLGSLPITRIIATHDLELVLKLCSRVIVLDRGEIVAQGNTAEVLADQQLMLEHGLETPRGLEPRRG